MIRIFTFFILLHIFCFSDLLAGTYSGGNGTVGNPYQISTTEDLIELSKTPADWSSHFVLTQFISFDPDEQLVDWDDDGTATWDSQDQLGFSPIGNNTTNFTGTFDGQGFEIENLFINRPSQNDVGSFGRTGPASQIKNLGVINAVITGTTYVGGLVGWNYDGTVSNTYSTGSVTGDFYVGGLVGWNYGTVSNTYSTGSVTGDFYVGGLVGLNDGTVSNSYSTGSVTGDFYVGGLVGVNYFGTVSNSYSTGSVTGDLFVGGLVGITVGTVSNCFWDMETSGRSTSAGGTGKTTAEMKDVATFTDENTLGLTSAWDFVGNPNDDEANDDIWKIHPINNDGYPYFHWQFPCEDDVFISELYDGNTPGWQATHHDNLDDALAITCDDATINISNFTHTGNIDLDGYTVITGESDFTINGNISGGLIRTTNSGKLVQSAVQNTTRTFPVTDGTNNFTVTVTPTSPASSGNIGVKLNTGKSVDGSLVNPLTFWDIYGPPNLNATVTLRMNKAVLGATTIPQNALMRFWNGTRYQAIPTDNVTISDQGPYYLITITGMNYFNEIPD